MEVVQFPCMSTVHSPGLAGLQEGGYDDGSVDFELCLQADFPSLPDSVVQSSKVSTSFCDSAVNFVDVNHLGESAAEICEPVGYREAPSFH